jgi:glycosyltransferase involved in cell wall biosynthesis
MTTRVLIDARYADGTPSGIGRYTEQVARRLRGDPGLRLGTVVRDERHAERLGLEAALTFDVEPNSLRTRYWMGGRIDGRWDLYWSPFNILPERVEAQRIFTLHDVMWLIDPSYCTHSRWRRLVTGTFYRTAIPRSIALADAIMTVSDASRRDIEEMFPAVRGRVFVTPNAVAPTFAPMADDEGWDVLSDLMPARTPFVLAVGQGSPYKNHGRALAAFWEAFAREPDARFVLVRRFERGPDPILDDWLGRREVARRVIRVSGVSEEVLRALYAKAILFAFPSLYEGFGIPSLEAMASGTPVVTSDYGAMAEVAADAAATVDPRDVSEIAAAMRRIRDDAQWAGTLRERGLRRAAEYDWDRTARAVRRVFEEVA